MASKVAGFIQLPILAAIALGIFVLGGGTLLGMREYQKNRVAEQEAITAKDARMNELQAKLDMLAKSIAATTSQQSTSSPPIAESKKILALQKEIDTLKKGQENTPQTIVPKSVLPKESPNANGSLSAIEISRKVAPSVALVSWENSSTYSHGSGFLIDGSGTILTNAHVVEEITYQPLSLVSVRIGNKTYWGKVLGTNEFVDVALVKVDDVSTPFMELGNSDESVLPMGSKLYVFGYPLDLVEGKVSMIQGVLSSIRTLPDSHNNLEHLQIDASTQPGDSGGPYVNELGQVVAMNVAGNNIFDQTGSKIGGGIGWGIPINSIKSQIEGLRNQKQILDTKCKGDFGDQSYYAGKKNPEMGPICECNLGFMWNTQNTKCVLDANYWCQQNNPGKYPEVKTYPNGNFSCACFGSPTGSPGRTQLGDCKSPQ